MKKHHAIGYAMDYCYIFLQLKLQIKIKFECIHYAICYTEITTQPREMLEVINILSCHYFTDIFSTSISRQVY